NEELGALLQVPAAQRDAAIGVLRAHGLSAHSHVVGKPNDRGVAEGWRDASASRAKPLAELQQPGDETSWRIAKLRDTPACADSEHALAGQADDPGLHVSLTFDPKDNVAAPLLNLARHK